MREAQNVGQAELVKLIVGQGAEMNQAKLSRIEGQLIAVTDQDLFAIAQALHTTVDSLFQ